MNKHRLLTLMGNTFQYYQKIKKLFGSSLVAYYPLWESSGITAVDLKAGNNGTYAGVTVGSGVSQFNKPCPVYPGTDAFVNIYSANLNTAIVKTEGTIIQMVKIATADEWVDNTARYLFCLQFADTNNRVFAWKLNTLTNPGLYFSNVGGGTTKDIFKPTKTTEWCHVVYTWSVTNNRSNLYFNGVDSFGSVTEIGTITGNLDSTRANIGSVTATFGEFKGLLSDFIVLNREITAAEVKRSYDATKIQATVFSILGDSIEGLPNDWSDKLTSVYNNGKTSKYRHAVDGMGIVGGATNLAAQVTAASNDNADKIIIALGTNDANAGDMVALQAAYEAGIVALKASNPRATIYAMNVLKRWANQTDGAEVDKSNIRTAIAAACTAQGITCWDTYTTSWILQTDTSDGLHPTAAGHAKIAAEVLALLP